MKSLEISHQNLIKLFGAYDKNADIIQRRMNVRLLASDGKLLVYGDSEDAEEKVRDLFDALVRLIGMGYQVNDEKIEESIDLALEGRTDDIIELSTQAIAHNARGEAVYCKTIGQRRYVRMIEKKQLVFGIGPAGTGKTFLAVAMAVKAFKAGDVQKIVLTRPAIEVGEKLGFLPGDMQDKVDPYLRPLYDALETMFGDSYDKLIERGVIEVAPLAYMRGRTLSNAFIILDEAQNTTDEQMKMFLTRIGENSKMVVNGDLSQSDLPQQIKRGLKTAVDILGSIEEIAVCRLTGKDVVRNRLVRLIVDAYDRAAQQPTGTDELKTENTQDV